VPIAAITFEFDPVLRLADGLAVRWYLVALVAIITVGLVAAGLIARRDGLRADDLLFIAVASVPGAIIGGRLGYVLLHLDYYTANVTAVTDPAQGSLELSLAMFGGMLSASYVAVLLGAPIGQWLRAATLPLLFMLGAGKLAMVLDGSGQGQPSDVSWATAYLGAGPWATMAPELPSHPAQVYEGIATLVILVLLTLLLAAGSFKTRDGRLFFLGMGTWALARGAVTLTWRDSPVVLGFGAGSFIAAALTLVLFLAGLVVLVRPQRPGKTGPSDLDLSWADPSSRPRF
jgi:phosphatidylglycerol:prolipoprotein diacylglycerol transferase